MHTSNAMKSKHDKRTISVGTDPWMTERIALLYCWTEKDSGSTGRPSESLNDSWSAATAITEYFTAGYDQAACEIVMFQNDGSEYFETAGQVLSR